MDQSFPVLKLCSSCTSKEEAAAYALPLHQFSRHLRQVFWEEMTHSKLRMSSSPLLKKASFYFKINKTFICDIKILKARGAPNLICFIDRSDAFRLQLKSAAVAFIESVSSVWNIFGGTEMAGVGLGPRSVIVVEKRVATRISPLH